MKVSMMAGLAGLAVCSAAFAQNLAQSNGGQRVSPVAYARATIRHGTVQLAGEWKAYGQGVSSRGVGALRFDSFGPDQSADSDLPRRPVTSEQCVASGLPNGSRYFFNGYNNPHTAHNYRFDDGNAEGTATLSNIDYAWYVGSTDGSTETPYVLGIFFYSDSSNDMDNECVGPATDGTGYVFDFGTLGVNGGYWYTNIDGLDVDGVTISANGTYEVLQGSAFDANTNTLTLMADPFFAEPMLYGTPDARGEVGPGRQGRNQMDDDNPLDGVFDLVSAPPECYGYDYGVCPDPLAGTIAIWSLGGGSPCLVDWNGDGFVDFFDYDDYVNCFETGTCVGHDTADYNGDGFVDFFDYDDFVNAFENGC